MKMKEKIKNYSIKCTFDKNENESRYKNFSKTKNENEITKWKICEKNEKEWKKWKGSKNLKLSKKWTFQKEKWQNF